MSLNVLEKELLRIQEKIEEVKLWQSLIDNSPFQDKRHKFQNVMEKAHQTLVEFSKSRILELEGNKQQTHPEISPVVIPLKKDNVESNKTIQVAEKIISDGEEIVEIKNVKVKEQPPRQINNKLQEYKNKQVAATSQRNNFRFNEGQEVNLLTTMTLAAVNEVQANKFVPGDKVKIIRLYVNQYGDECAEIVKTFDRGMAAKAIVSLEDLQ